jgi:hypothetical protein
MLLGIPSINKISHSMQRLAQACRAPILGAINGQVEGIFGIADTLSDRNPKKPFSNS